MYPSHHNSTIQFNPVLPQTTSHHHHHLSLSPFSWPLLQHASIIHRSSSHKARHDRVGVASAAAAVAAAAATATAVACRLSLPFWRLHLYFAAAFCRLPLAFYRLPLAAAAARVRKSADGTITVAYCPTKEMVSDYLSKPLQGSLFRLHRNTIMGLTEEMVDDYCMHYMQAKADKAALVNDYSSKWKDKYERKICEHILRP